MKALEDLLPEIAKKNMASERPAHLVLLSNMIVSGF